MRFNITGKLVALIGVLLLIQGSVIIAWMTSQYHHQLVDQSLRDLQDEAQRVAADLESYLDDAATLTLALQNVPPIQGIARAAKNDGVDPVDGSTMDQWLQRIETIFESFALADKPIVQIRYIGADGHEIARVDRTHAGAPIRIVPQNQLQLKWDTSYFRDTIALPKGSLYFSRIELNREHGRISEPSLPVFRIGTPVYDETGKLFGAIVINLDMGYAFAQLGRSLLPGQSLYVANETGDFLVHPDPSKTFGFDLGARHTLAGEFPTLENLRVAEGGVAVIEPREPEDVTRVAGMAIAAQDERYPMRQLFVMVGADYDAIAAGPMATLQKALVGLIVFLLIVSVLKFVVLRRFLRPVMVVSRAATAVAEGDLSARANVRSSDEIGQLAKAFNHMADSLQKQHLALQERAEGLGARMRAIVETAADAIITVDEHGVVDSANSAVASLFGFPPDEVVGMHITALVPCSGSGAEPSEQSMPADLRAIIGQGKEFAARRHNGERFPIFLSLSAIQLDNRELFTCIVRDITELKQAQRELNQFFTLSLELLCITSTDGCFRRVNLAFEEVLGYRTREASEHRFIDFVHPDDRERVSKAFARLDEGKSVLDLECRYRRKDGSYVWLEWTAMSVVAEGIIYAAARNVTEHKRLREELEAAKDSAERANRAKSDFLATMSHELRTPLNGVVGMTELILQSDLNEKQRHHASLAKLSADTLLALINDILDFSKIEADQLELEDIEFDLCNAVEAVALSVSIQAEQKGVELIVFVDPQLRTLRHGDPGRLQQVLLNLVSNAVKFTDTGGEVVVEVRPEVSRHRQEHVRVTVSDTGIGVRNDRVGSLFQAFSQADTSTTRKYGGTGLGLAICKRLVELMGGTIGVATEEGVGSTFWFTLPLPASAQAADAPESDSLSGQYILIVDDNATNRELLEEHLSALGATYASASSGEEALRILKEHAQRGEHFTAACLDLNMPGMNGIELAEAINAHPAIPDLPLVLLGSFQLHDTERLREAGFKHWMCKPIRQSQLVEYILKATGRQVQTSSAPNMVSPSAPCDLSGSLVLVAEDDIISQVVAKGLLAQARCEHETVPDGRQAVEAASTRRFDLVLMDGHMPVLDGLNATREIRQLESKQGGLARNGKRLPIIAITANVIKEDRRKYLDAGMDDFLSKPLTPALFFQKLQQFLAPGTPVSGASVDDGDPAFDVEGLLRRWEQMHDLVQRILDQFATQGPEAVAELERSIADRDMARTRDLAHKLKGSAGYVEARAVHRLAAEIQELAEGSQVERASQTVEKLRREIERCVREIPALQNRVNQHSTPQGGIDADE